MGVFFMRIENNSVNKILNIYANQSNVSKTTKTDKTKKTDQLNISSTGRDFQIAMDEIKNQPEVRTEKVDELRNQIKAGTYNVDAKSIAEKMLSDANAFHRL